MSVPVTGIHDLRQPTISPEKVVLETSQTSVRNSPQILRACVPAPFFAMMLPQRPH
jgi:hypothetical protein